jgi:PAS domain S-box-containing protein
MTQETHELKTTQAALRACDARYRFLFENSRDAILITNPKDGIVVAANPAASRLFEYSLQELLFMQWDELLDRSDPRFLKAWAERERVGAVVAELTFIRRGGTRLEARISSQLFSEECDGQVACSMIYVPDKKRAE